MSESCTGVNNESKVTCGICGTELTDTAVNKWCPKCQLYPTSITITTIPSAPMQVSIAPIRHDVMVSGEEYNRLKQCEAENVQLKVELAKAKEQATCGCGICLVHNGGVCPKLKESEVQNNAK